jgi:predicted RNase H-like nuclease
VGIDGCPGGWIAVALDLHLRTFAPRIHSSFPDAIAAHPNVPCVAVDIPIGLTLDGPRPCDLEARRVLGPRRSSVFQAPDPRLLDAPTYAEALVLARSLTGKGISIQGFAIQAKIAEANRVMTPLLQGWVAEVHPEVSFWALAGGQAMAFPKRTPDGYEERKSLLEAALGLTLPRRDEARKLAPPASADDLLDALAAAWSALRIVEGRAGRLPTQPSYGVGGLRMEIAY